MASLNKVQIIGNLGRDPEIRYMTNGDAAVTLAVATTEKWTDKTSGEKKEATEWHRVNFFGRLAEVCGEYLTKGSPIYVEGALKSRKYTDKDGIERYVTEIAGRSMQMLGSGGSREDAPQRQAPARQQSAPQRRAPEPTQDGPMDDDIPF